MNAPLILLAGLLLGQTAAAPTAAPVDEASPLANYIAQEDASYGWTVRRRGELAGGSYAELILTSQTWHGIDWRHQLFVFKPSAIKTEGHGVLMIAGSAWRDHLDQPPGDEERLPSEAGPIAAMANQIGAPVAVLLQVPFQPMFGGRNEDDLIAFTFEQYLDSGDSTWPLLLPMVKSAVRGMDAVQEFAAAEWNAPVEQFTVTGASKRGWTTWLTAAADERVTCLAPMVIDVLNMGPQMEHQMRSWGEFSEQIDDYTRRGLQARLDTPEGKKLTAIVDPYAYRRQIDQPKLILLGTNDRYWPLDALNLYWDGLVGEKHVLYIPNNGHGLRDYARVIGTVGALHRQAAGQLKLPQLGWRLERSGEELRLEVTSDKRPAEVRAWVASSSTRDFRDATWKSYPAEKNADGWHYALPLDDGQYWAMFGEASYFDAGLPYYLSTNVEIAEPASAQ